VNSDVLKIILLSFFKAMLINTIYEHSECDNYNELKFSTDCLFIPPTGKF